MSLSILAISYCKIIEIFAQSIKMKERELQTTQIAKAGIEDAIYEIRQGTPWTETGLQGHGWKKVANNTFAKSTVSGSLKSSLFNLSSTFSVELTGDPVISTVDITSYGEIKATSDVKTYKRVIGAKVIKSPNGEVYILEMREV